MPLTPGRILNNRYRIVKLLGQGGFGAVYRAWDTNLEAPVAIKECLDVSPEAQKQFKLEAQLLFKLHHNNLPRVHDHFIIPDQGQYLVMDFVEGQDLAEMLKSGPLPEARVLPWIIQVCDALSYLHSQNPPVIHRDIKPGNIKITPNGKAMLVDFGISKIYNPALATTAGARAVTPGYSPPEQYGKGVTDIRSDLYALGATLYHLLTGQLPPDSVDILSRVASPPPFVVDLNPAVSEAIGSAIARAMALDRESRWANAQDFKHAITTKPSSGNKGGQTHTVTTQVVTPPLSQNAPVRAGINILGLNIHSGWLGAGGAFGLVVVVILAAIVVRSLLTGGKETPGSTTEAGVFMPSDTTAPQRTIPPVATVTQLTYLPLPTAIGGGTGKIAFDSYRTGDDEIYLINSDGSGIKRLTNRRGFDKTPRWSPDGSTIAFSSDRSGVWEIWTMGMDGSFPKQLTNLSPKEIYTEDWSEYGLIVFSALFTDLLDYNYSDIYTMQSDGTELNRLTNNSYYDVCVSYSPDAQKVVFRSNRGGSNDFYIMNIDGSEVVQLTDEGTVDYCPDWSPNQSLIVYPSNGELYTIFPDGSNRVKLTNNSSNELGPRWSLDGKLILFISDIYGNNDLFFMNADGSNWVRLTDNGSGGGEWQPLP